MRKFFGKERRKHLANVAHALAIGFSLPLILEVMKNPDNVSVIKVLLVFIFFIVMEAAAVLLIQEGGEK